MSSEDTKASRWMGCMLAVAASGGLALDMAGLAGLTPLAVPYSVFALMLFIGVYGLSLREEREAAAAPAPELQHPVLDGGVPAMPTALIDATHRCVEATAALSACLGLQRADVVGLPFDDIFGPLNAPTVGRHIDGALAGQMQRLRLC